MHDKMFWSVVFGVTALTIFKQILLDFNTFNHFKVVKCLQMTKTKHLHKVTTRLKKVIFCLLFCDFFERGTIRQKGNARAWNHADRSNSKIKWRRHLSTHCLNGERGGSVVECRTPEREVRGSRPTAAVLCPWARHFTPRKYWLITKEAMAPSRYDWKIVDWDVKPQHNQPLFKWY